MSADLAAFCYLIAGALFIMALRGLSSPETSRRGNGLGMTGMAIAIVTTLAPHPPASPTAWGLVVAGMARGGDLAAGTGRRLPLAGRDGRGAGRGRRSLCARGFRYRQRRRDPRPEP